MTSRRIRAEVPAIALEPARAAAALDMSETTFREQVAPDLRVVRLGGKVLYPVSELYRWVDERASRTLVDQPSKETT